MADAKTKPTEASVSAYLDAIPDAGRRADCAVLADLMRKATGEPPRMWGPSIVGFGSYAYTYASGRQGTSCITGFAARKGDISVYLVASGPSRAELLTRLGKHKMGKACLTIRRLSDVDLAVLERLIVDSVGEVRQRHAG